MTEAVQTEYKGNPMLTIRKDADDKYPFSFGVKKARLIIDHINDIQAFVAENEGGGDRG